MTGGIAPQFFFLVSLGLVVGGAVFVRGLVAYRRGALVGSIATSSAVALAAGEVRLTGTVQPLVATLVSPLQSQPCVWYRSSIVENGRDAREIMREERSVEFALRDETGTVRIIPRGARWEIPDTFDESTDLTGDAPIGLSRRVGPASTVAAQDDREAAITNLLTVRPAAAADPDADAGSGLPGLVNIAGGRRHYREARLEPGQVITVVGFALPFSTLPGQPSADTVFEAQHAFDPTLGADLAEARAAGQLADSALAAWGNAAIPGFGIGRPEEPPRLDPEADPLPLAEAAQATRAEQLFEIPAEELVVSGGPDTGLVIYAGEPQQAVAQQDQAFLLGLGGAAVATVSALALVMMIRGAI